MKLRLISTFAAAAVMAPVLMLAGSGQAAAASKTVQWKNKVTGQCLGSVHDQVLMNGCQYRMTNWKETKQSDGTFVLQNTASLWCLDSRKNGTVYLHKCNGGNNQKWHEIKTPQGWRLQNKATKLTLGYSKGRGVYAGYDGSLGQRWS